MNLHRGQRFKLKGTEIRGKLTDVVLDRVKKVPKSVIIEVVVPISDVENHFEEVK